MSSQYCTYDSTTWTYETISSMQFNRCTIHVTSQSLFCVITPSVLRASHPLFVWHHTRHRYSIFCTIEDITCSLYEIKPPVLWHRTHYVWQHNPVTFGIYMTSFALQKTSYPLYHTKPQSLWLHVHFRHDITPPLTDIAPTVSLSSQLLHWYHTQFCMTSHPLYVWYHMHYI